MSLPAFPNENSIPPACFYNIHGLAHWLNLNPQYKVNFSYTGLFFPYLIPPEDVTSSLAAAGYSQEKVPLCSNVTTLSQHQAQKYNTQINLFRKVYSTNSNAYTNYVLTGQPPVYYNFSSFNEKYEYNSAVGLINKLYNFKAMSDAPGLHWQVPFPIGM